MESVSKRIQDEEARQSEIRRQIATLKAQLVDLPVVGDHSRVIPQRAITPEIQREQLVPATPSPKKKRKLVHSQRNGKQTRASLPNATAADSRTRLAPAKPSNELQHPKPAPSNVLNKLATLHAGQKKEVGSTEMRARTSAFSEPAPAPLPRVESSQTAGPSGVIELSPQLAKDGNRDDRLAIVEELTLGPYDHKAPFDDPHFNSLEPNSGIRLSSRTIPNEDFQDYLRGRYYLSPSKLYSVIRLLPDKQGYDVPVDSDWVTIAVVAERGPVKYSRAPVGIGPEDDANEGVNHSAPSNGSNSHSKGKQKAVPQKLSGKKYVNIKLVDFGSRSRSSSTQKAAVRGDAFLTLLLFESDGFEKVTKEDGEKLETIYKGGSRGAFEAMSKVKEGDVIALLNPRVLKPFQRSESPHPISNILALTPESAASIAVIGRSRDLGMCAVVKRDSKPCGSWCDKRVSDVCEWHVQNAVQQRRAGRAEFSIGTSGMAATAVRKRKPAYDPARQWGLKPADPTGSGGATYVVSGHVVSGPGGDGKYAIDDIGREGQAKAARKLSAKESDRQLKALLERDKEGMRAVVKAREAGKKETSQKKDEDRKGQSGKKKRKKEPDSESSEEACDEPPDNQKHRKTYSAQMIKHLGFDPAVKIGQKRMEDAAVQKKLEALQVLQSSRKKIVLAPRPGQRIRSGVSVPVCKSSHTPKAPDRKDLPQLEESDEDLENGLAMYAPTDAPADKMVDLDVSSD